MPGSEETGERAREGRGGGGDRDRGIAGLLLPRAQGQAPNCLLLNASPPPPPFPPQTSEGLRRRCSERAGLGVGGKWTLAAAAAAAAHSFFGRLLYQGVERLAHQS